MFGFRKKVAKFTREEMGASLVEYAVALIVVVTIGGILFQFGGNIADIIDLSAGAF